MEIVEKIKSLLKLDLHKKIVFFFDEDASRIDDLQEIEAAGIHVITVDGKYFALKYRLDTMLSGKEVFLYHPFPFPDKQNIKKYPLLDLLKANHELRLDEVSDFLQTYLLSDSFRPLVTKHIALLKSKSNQKKLATILFPDKFSEEVLLQGLLSVLFDFNQVVSINISISRFLIHAGDKNTLSKRLQQLKDVELDSYFLSKINDTFVTQFSELSLENCVHWIQKLKYNMLTAFIDKPAKDDNYKPLKIKSTVALNKLKALFADWQQHPQLSKSIEATMSSLGSQVKEDVLVAIYGTHPIYGFYSDRLIVEVVHRLLSELDVEPHMVEHKATKWLDLLQDHMNSVSQMLFIRHCAGFYATQSANPKFNFSKPDDFIREYTDNLYWLDTHYRKALTTYERIVSNKSDLDTSLVKVFDKLHDDYDAYLMKLNLEWQDALRHCQFSYKDINIPKQYDFFNEQIKGIDHKMVVIISDAFRYEVAKELESSLLTDAKNTVQLTPYLASIPSYTNIGMTNLLPTDDLTVEKGDKELVFKIGGIHTTHPNRQSILQRYDPTAATVDFSELIKMDKTAGRSFFKNHRLVYIYHDWIDAVGDKKRTEHETFAAVDKAKTDIESLIVKLYGWNVYHIIVTADHGFIYNYKEIKEPSREVLPETAGFSRDHIRFSVAEKFTSKVNGYLFPMSHTTKLDTDLQIALPRAINRFRIRGNVGVQFAHGGGSIQELLIPVLKFYKQKKEAGRQVSFRRIDTTDRINTGSIKVELLQDDPITSEVKGISCVIGLYAEDGRLLSDEKPVQFNSTSSNPKDRVQSAILFLNSEGSKASFGYLRAYDEKDNARLNPLYINDLLKINTLMERDDF